jgi:hypothetical protein
MRPLAGIPEDREGVLTVVGVGAGAIVLDARAPECAVDRRCLYGVVRHRRNGVLLGIGRSVAPAADGRTVWLHDSSRGSRCAVRQVGLEGRLIRAARPFPCGTRSDPPGNSLGLVVGRTRLVDPFTGRTVLRTRWGIVAAAREHLVLYGPGHQFTVLDAETHNERRLQWPSSLTYGGEAYVDATGRYVVLEFGDPAWQGSGAQVLDLWSLDTKTGKLTQVPGMPAFVALKGTSVAWTSDGRLVLLGEDNRGGFVAVWRPGGRRIAVKNVELPERTSGSDSFAVLG